MSGGLRSRRLVRTTTGSEPRRGDRSCIAQRERACVDPRSGRLQLVVAVAQTPGGLTEAFLRVGSKKPQVVARPRRALLGLGAASPLSDRHSERGLGFPRRLCATPTVQRRHVHPRYWRARLRTKAELDWKDRAQLDVYRDSLRQRRDRYGALDHANLTAAASPRSRLRL